MSEIRGLDRLLRQLKSLTSGEIEQEVSAGLFAAANEIKVEAQLSITRGAVSGKNHTPSKPGEPPQNDTGFLADHIQAIQTAKDAVKIVSDAPYSVDLEFGTSLMGERPFMRPAVAAKKKKAVEIMRRTLQRGIRNAMNRKGI